MAIMASAGVSTLFDAGQWADYEWSIPYEPALAGEVFDVTNYSADVTGYLDSTTGINLAIDAAKAWSLANGNEPTTIFFPAGTYRVWPKGTVDNPGYAFTVTFENVTFEGAGANLSAFTFRAQGSRNPDSDAVYKRGGLFNVTGISGFTGNVTFRGFRACGNAQVTSAGGGDWYGGGSFTGWDITHKGIGCFGGLGLGNILIEDCEWDHWRGEALYAGGGDELGTFTVQRCVVRRVNASAISMGGDVSILDGTRVYDCLACTECFFFGGQTFTVDSSHFHPNKNLTGPLRIGTYGVITHGYPTATCVITDNFFGDTGTGAIFLSESTSNLTIDGNDFTDTRAVYCIYIGQYPSLVAFMNQFNLWSFTNNTIRAVTRNIDTAISTTIETGYDFDFSSNTIVNANGFTVAQFVTHFAPDKTPEEKARLTPDGAYTAESNTLAGAVAGYPPVYTAPVISVTPPGPAVVGATIACTRGTWLTDGGWIAIPGLTYSYQWMRNGTPIGGATSATYIRDAADSGTELTCEVTANNGTGDKVQASNALAIA